MKRLMLLSAAALALMGGFVLGAPVYAQSEGSGVGTYALPWNAYTPSPTGARGYYTPYYNPGFGYGYPYFNSPAAAYGFGYGQALRGAGQYNLDTARAAEILEDTREQALKNRREAVQQYWDLRALNQAARKAERPAPNPNPDPEIAARIAKLGVPDRPNADQLDPETQIVLWPELLSDPAFDEPRQAIDMLYGRRTWVAHGLGSRFDRDVRANVDEMRRVLKERMGDLTPNEFLTAKKFLDSIAYESRFAPPAAPLERIAAERAPPAR